MRNSRERADYPKNPERLVMLDIDQVETIFPMSPEWAICGIGFNPKTGGVYAHLRKDGLPENEAPIPGGRIYVAIDAPGDVLEEMASDILQYLRERGFDEKKSRVAYVRDADAKSWDIKTTG